MKNKIQIALLFTILAFGVQGKFTHLAAQPSVDFSSTGVCVGSPTVFTVNTAVTNVAVVTNWNWDFGDGFFSTIQNPTHTFLAPGTYTVILAITDTSGAIGTATHFVTIEPLPIANFSYNTPNCQNEPIQFTDLSSTLHGFINTWIWNYGDGTPNDTIHFPGDPNVTHVFPTFGTFNVTLTITNSLNCTNAVSIPVVVTPGPIANFYFTGKCQDQIVQFTDASFANGAGNVVGWSWDFGDPTSGMNNASNLTDPTHIFSDSGTFLVRLIIVNFNNCRDTITKQVHIYPHPPVDFTFTTTCLNELVYFDPDTVVTHIGAIPTWFWDFGDGGTSTARNTAHAYISPGTYTVMLTITDTAGCMNTVSHDVVIYPLPVAHFDAGTNLCAGANVHFTSLCSTSFGFVNKWVWDFGDGTFQTVIFPANPNVTHTYLIAGNFNVTLTITASDSCFNFETQVITIHPNPNANFDFTKPVCDGSLVSFTDLSQSNGGGSLVQWAWDFGDPITGVANLSTLPSPDHLFSAPGIFNVSLVVVTSNGCSDTVTYQVTVKAKPAVDFLSDHNCQNNAVLFHPNTATMNTSVIVTWAWAFGDGGTSPLQSPSHTYASAGTFNVTLTVTDTAGCTNSITKPVTIVPQPVSNFDFSQPACKQSAVQFTSLANAPVGYIVKWVWIFGDGGTQTVLSPGNPNVTHTYANYGTFNVTLTVTTNDSCTRTFTKPITVIPNPLANFSYLTSCVNSPVQFNDLSQPGSGGIADWLWNFGDGGSGANNTSSLQNPTHTFTAPGTYFVTLIVTNSGGCKDTILNKPVLVHALPAVDFTSQPGCMNDSTHFISSTFVDSLAVTSRVWNFGDGITSNNVSNPYHIYANSGVYTVTLTVTDTAGCINVKSHVVTISPPPDAFFQVSAPLCANNPVFFNDLSTLSSGQFTSWAWDFGDGSDTLIIAPASPDIYHVYITAGTYSVTLKVNTSQGCEDTFPQTITISASPVADFIFDNTCAASAVVFTNQSTVNGGTTITGYNWNFGDPTSGNNNTSTLQNPLHIYAMPGTYIVLLQATNADACPDTTSHPVTILPKPAVDYSWTNICIGTSTAFTVNTAVTIVGAVQAFDWDFGDGTPHSTQQDPTHTYTVAGTYQVTLSITDTAGCMNSKLYSVIIHAQPVASFSYTSGCLNTPVQFTDQSFTSSGEPITGWHWSFGLTPADTSNIQNPSWTYTTLGIYTVTLIVTSQSGCMDTTQVAIQVFGLPQANFNYTAAPCNFGAVYFQDSSFSQQATIVGWNWEFEPGQFSTLQNPVHVFYAPDSCYSVHLTVMDIRGCTDDTTMQVCVPATLAVNFSAPETCFQDTTYFTPHLMTPIGDSLVFFNWNFGDPTSGIHNTSTLRTPSHYYSQPGTYTVILETTDINNCPAQVNNYVIINPLPVAQFAFNSGTCDTTMFFSQSSSGSGSPITSWIWAYGDGQIDTIVSAATAVSHKYPAPGNYQVKLTVNNFQGCHDTLTQSVFVKPCIVAAFQPIDTLICQNYTLSFADSSSFGIPVTNWYWDFGDGTTVTYTDQMNPVTHVYILSGTYTVKLVITTSLDGNSISDSTTKLVLVNPSPVASFNTGKACFGTASSFANTTSTNGVPVKQYSWNFGEPSSGTSDTTSLKNPSHKYKAPGLYNVQLIATNSLHCIDTLVSPLEVNPLPAAAFSNTLSCAGDKTMFTDLSDSAVAPLNTWNWTFRGSSGVLGYRTEQNPSFTFATPGNYTVILAVSDTNGCADTLTQNVTSYIVPTSIFAYKENFDNIQGQLQFVNTSLDGVKYYWDFGNGESSYADNPVAFYQNDGTYTVTLISWSDKECSDTTRLDYTFMVKGLYVPNAFSPNNPHEEVKVFKPVGINLDKYKIEVFDRWGNQLWWSDKIDDKGRPLEGWNGKTNGVDVQEGVYVWKASAVFKDGTIWNNENVGTSAPLPTTVYGTVTVVK